MQLDTLWEKRLTIGGANRNRERYETWIIDIDLRYHQKLRVNVLRVAGVLVSLPHEFDVCSCQRDRGGVHLCRIEGGTAEDSHRDHACRTEVDAVREAPGLDVDGDVQHSGDGPWS